MLVRSFSISVALALAGSIVCAQSRQPGASSKQNSQAVAQQNSRIISLLEDLADQSGASENLAFATRAQSQAATLLWPHDAERARSIYRRAFQSLAEETSSSSSSPVDGSNRSRTLESGTALTSAQKHQLRSELLNQIAPREPELAEELARSLVDSVEVPNGGVSSRAQSTLVASSSREDAERCELLMSAALQIVDRDPQQAMAFAQMSVALGISSNLARLLTLMRTVDAERADLLFSNAVARLEQYSRVDLADLHTLGSYVVAVANSATKQPLSKTTVVRFLNLALNQIAERGALPAAKNTDREQSPARYFIERQLTDLFARYLPGRLDQLHRYVSDQSESGSYDQAIDPGELGVRAPADIVRDAIEATDAAERDSLYAGAALGWIARGDVIEAQAAALKISSDGMRDRVLVQIVRRHSSEKRIEDATALARRIVDAPSRVDLLVMLSSALLSSKDTARAVELLNEAETCSLKAPLSIARARSLMRIASSFSVFDTLRGFEVLQSAVKTINEITRQQEDLKEDRLATSARAKAAQRFTLDELYAASFERTLVALAKADFDRALFLAQQLSGEETSVIAQLAVCRGGLVEKVHPDSQASEDEIESGVNQR